MATAQPCVRGVAIREPARDGALRPACGPIARCEVDGQHYETEGPAAIYKISTLLWLHGHGGEHYEVWDDRDPIGRPGGLALTGRVRNWARLGKGKLSFNHQAVAAGVNPAQKFDKRLICISNLLSCCSRGRVDLG